MTDIASQTKVLRLMAKGETPFDRDAARMAVAAIAGHARETRELFRLPETDPQSEALQTIWTDVADFSAKSDALVLAAENALGLRTIEDVGTAAQEIGATCRSCHQRYRLDR